jgi:nucleoside 2-deoxyribosyltransferase
MEFHDNILDPFVKDVLKPHVKEKLKIDVVDMRDSSKAGIIDNIMRERIRDAKFVLVDLTHENAGAYWEAGYAEGLGKPVIYLCEQTKFDEKKTHFDTNHCTTVMWSKDGDNQKFKDELIATLRRSLNLFE